MKTSIEMQLKIADKIKSNIESGVNLFDGIQLNGQLGWLEFKAMRDMREHEYRIKPETITINGVEIPKPLNHDGITSSDTYYFPQCREKMYGELMGISIIEYDVWYAYSTKEEAIEASKLLFGIK